MTTVMMLTTEGQIREQARRIRIQTRAAEVLHDLRVHMKPGHYDVGNGRHSRDYFNPHEILKTPHAVWQLAQLLIELVGDQVKRARVIAAPFTGGAILAHTVACLLDGNQEIRPLGDPPKLFVPISEVKGAFEVKQSYVSALLGADVWLLDDVKRSGHTLINCAQVIEIFGGNIVGTSVILQGSGPVLEDLALAKRKVPHDHLAEFDVNPVDYPVAECPMCQSDDPEVRKITRF